MGMLEVGIAKRDTVFHRKGNGLMGYGRDFNFIKKDGGTPLFARAYVFKDPKTDQKIAFVNAEICFITISIKLGVLKKLTRLYPELGYTDENLFLTAQHTHSGPGGYSHFGFYNLTIPGFVPEVYHAIVEGIFEAIVEADKASRPVHLRFASGEFEPEKEVAFQRSLKAYNSNPDVKKLSKIETHLAIDRQMDLMLIENEDGSPYGCINWFGVHTTSMSNDNGTINWDNKGYAADFMEKAIRKSPGDDSFYASFAQSVAGDVSPNFIWDWRKFWTRGKFKDDLESCIYNANLQLAKATELMEVAQKSEVLSVDIDYGLMYEDFSNIVPDPEFTGGKTDVRTGPSCIGVSMLAGTSEGPGMPAPIAWISRRLCSAIKYLEYIRAYVKGGEIREEILVKYRTQGKKHIIIETGGRRVLGTRNVKKLIIPGFVDGGMKTFKEHHRRGALDDKPWTPQTLPLQIAILGPIALIGIPGEITTVAGRRLRATLEKVLEARGVKKVILAPYANAYSGYITTYEEYQHQLYEAGHTVFGEYTLAAFQTKFKQLALEMTKNFQDRKLENQKKPATFSEEELEKRKFEGGFKELRKTKAKSKKKKLLPTKAS